jgi:transcriptional regulator with XRE-family HTH domain
MVSDVKKIIGRNIKAARELKRLKQHELGALLSPDATQQYVAKWETGSVQPRPKTLNQIAEVTGVKVGDLLDMQGKIYERWKKALDDPLGLEVESLEKPVEPAQFTEEDFRRFVREETEKLLRGVLSHDLTPWTDTDTAQGGIVEPAPGSAPRQGISMPCVESTELHLAVPDPPGYLDREEKRRWKRNAEVLQRWADTESAWCCFPRGVPPWAIERYCREAVGFYNGGGLSDVSGVLWDFIQEGKKG